MDRFLKKNIHSRDYILKLINDKSYTWDDFKHAVALKDITIWEPRLIVTLLNKNSICWD